MRVILVLCVLVAAMGMALARPQDPKEVSVVKYENDNIGTGGYNFIYELSDGTSRQETAELKNAGAEDEALVLRGSFSFVGPDGVTYTVTYVADENGFQPEGAHLPKAP